MNLNRNTVSILEALVSGNGSASVEELCRALGVNRQLLLYYLGTLNDSLRVAGYPKVELEGDWLSLDSTASAELAATIDAYDRADYAFVKEERHDLMTIMMALRPAPVTIGYLCSFFMVSRSTTTSDIAALRSLLDRESLALVSLGRGGYRIEGDERRLRWRVMDSFYRLDSVVAKRVARGVLLQSVREAVSPTDDQAEDLTEKIEGIVRSSIRAVEDASGEKLSFSLLGELVYYLLCVALRNRVCPTAAAGHSTGISLEGTPEWDVAARVMEGLRGVGLGIEHGERAYVAALLRGSRVFSLDDSGNASDLRSVQLVSALVEEFERQVCTSIAERDALMARLLPHVRAMVCRISYQVKLPSTILRHVSDNYRQLYNATNLVCKNLEVLTGMSFPPDEVAGLCVYFGSQDFGDHSAGQDLRRPLAYRKILVVCPSGIGTSLLVCSSCATFSARGFATRRAACATTRPSTRDTARPRGHDGGLPALRRARDRGQSLAHEVPGASAARLERPQLDGEHALLRRHHEHHRALRRRLGRLESPGRAERLPRQRGPAPCPRAAPARHPPRETASRSRTRRWGLRTRFASAARRSCATTS